MIVVLSLSMITFFARPKSSSFTFSSLMPSSSVTALLPVRIGTFVSVIAIGAQEKTGRKKIKTVEPIYPPLPGQLHLSGTVKMVLQINPEGKVSGVHTVGGNAIQVTVQPVLSQSCDAFWRRARPLRSQPPARKSVGDREFPSNPLSAHASSTNFG